MICFRGSNGNLMEFGIEGKLMRDLTADRICTTVIEEEFQKFEDGDLIKHPVTHRERLCHLLRSRLVEGFILAVIVGDMVALLSMIVIDMYISDEKVSMQESYARLILTYIGEHCPNISSSIVHAPSLKYAMLAVETIQKSAEDGDGGFNEMVRMRRAAGGGMELDADKVQPTYNLLKAQHILHYISVSLLSLLVLELILKLIAMGHTYFKKSLRTVDGFVTISSFVIDILYSNNQIAHEMGKSLIILALFWRCLRIMNAMMMAAKAKNMFTVKVLRRSRELLEEKLQASIKSESYTRKHMLKVIKIAQEHGVPEEIVLPPGTEPNMTGGMNEIRRMTATFMIMNGIGPRIRHADETKVDFHIGEQMITKSENNIATGLLGISAKEPDFKSPTTYGNHLSPVHALTMRKKGHLLGNGDSMPNLFKQEENLYHAKFLQKSAKKQLGSTRGQTCGGSDIPDQNGDNPKKNEIAVDKACEISVSVDSFVSINDQEHELEAAESTREISEGIDSGIYTQGVEEKEPLMAKVTNGSSENVDGECHLNSIMENTVAAPVDKHEETIFEIKTAIDQNEETSIENEHSFRLHVDSAMSDDEDGRNLAVEGSVTVIRIDSENESSNQRLFNDTNEIEMNSLKVNVNVNQSGTNDHKRLNGTVKDS